MEKIKNYKGVQVEGIRNARSAEDARLQLEDRILDKIAENNEIEISESAIENEVSRMVCEMHYRMRYENMATGGYGDFMQMQDEMDERMKKFREEAIRQLKARKVIEEIIQAENLQVTQEELEEEALAISKRQKMPVEMIKDFLGKDMGLLKQDLLVRKAMELIYNCAVIL